MTLFYNAGGLFGILMRVAGHGLLARLDEVQEELLHNPRRRHRRQRRSRRRRPHLR